MTKRDWIKGKQADPYIRPRIDWWATWRQFIPFWVCFCLCVGIAWMLVVLNGGGDYP